MIEIKDNKNCCGCHACATVCAKRCITMESDVEGFLYPKVDKEACSDCGLCEKVCPVINQSEPRKPLKVYAAKNKNEEIRRQSSSGGIFTLLAEKVINEGGVVFGARFDQNWDVVHSWTDTIEGIAAFRGSKYVQSTVGDTYREAKDFLKQGRKVLFSGTPCQIAGLKKYLRKDYDNLLTVDVVCHGVPSPLTWRTYLKETREQLCAKRSGGKKIPLSSIEELPIVTGISFRDKTNGWKRYGFRLSYATSGVTTKSVEELFLTADKFYFLHAFDYMLRPSCFNCKCKNLRSNSDITIGDYWGIYKYMPLFDDDRGVSAVIVNSERGISTYESLSNEIVSKESQYADFCKYNLAMCTSASIPNRRKQFWQIKDEGLILAIKRMTRPSFPTRIQRLLYNVLDKVRLLQVLRTLKNKLKK